MRQRGFEKVSEEQWLKDLNNIQGDYNFHCNYDEIRLPRKKDKNNTSQSGVWKGSIKINNMYRKGLRYPLS